MTCPDSILKLIQRFSEQEESYKSGSYNETQVRRDFIDPFFKELGWDIDNESGHAEAYRDVIHEDAVLVDNRKKAPDYSFRIGGVRKFFVEAKKPSVSIKNSPEPAFQVRRYAWSAKLPISIVTDFEELAVYDCSLKPNAKDLASKALLKFYSYKEYAEKWDEIYALFSKQAVLKGSFDKFADNKKKKGTTTVDNEFLVEIEKWRQNLAQNITKNNQITPRQLNHAVQVTIDRIVFLRICEDRGIEPYGKLEKIKSKKDIYKQLLSFFKDADDRYNSGLFHFNEKEKGRSTEVDTLTPKLKIDDEPLQELIESLYFPNPYEFSVIPSDILGQIYERFLGKVIVLENGTAKVEEKPDVKKAGGVFYTPTYVVKYIINNTVDKLLENKTPKQAEKISILDPACGSGSFLLVAYEHLLSWHLHYYLSNGGYAKYKKEISPTQNGGWQLSTHERKRILLNNIYGVDIDAQAVEVTKLSLLLKVLEGENSNTLQKQLEMLKERALPDLHDNIKCGNSLIGSDFYAQLGLPDLTEDEHYRINVFDWTAAFKKIFDGTKGFSAVIGNPPWGANIDKETIYFEQKYPSVVQQKTDSFKLFIGKSFDLIAKDGLFSFIVPNTVIRQTRYKDVRNLMLKYTVQEIIDLGENVFEDVIAPSCIFIIKNSTVNNTKNKYKYRDLSRAGKNQEKALALNENVYLSVQQSQAIQDNEKVFSIITKDKNIQELGDIKFIQLKDAGINYQRKNVGMQAKGNSDLSSRLLYEGTRIDDKNDKMYWKGSDINKFYIKESTDRFCRSNVNSFIKANESVVLNSEYFDIKPKLLIRQTADKPIVAYDDRGVWFGRSLFGLTIDKTSPYSIFYFLGLLNSKAIQKFYQEITGEKGRGFAQVKLAKLKQLPIKMPNLQEHSEKVLYDEFVETVKKLIALKKDIVTDTLLLQKQILGLQNRLDDIVYKIYGFTKEEIAMIESLVATG